ncbi:Short chain dehydrogenase andI [Talaromyces pinophilus]|nr:Short chain dehydrogenase andI [Talaromyces pinophilus]
MGAAYTATVDHDTYPTITAARCNQRGRTVLITGASRGIERVVAIAFVQAAASAIAIGSRSSQDSAAQEILEEAAKAGHPPPQLLKLTLDISDEESVNNAPLTITQSFGRLDILVNNVGRLEKWLPLAGTDPSSWGRTWEVNVKGTYLMTRPFIPLLLQGGEKTIVNMNSVGAHLSRPGASAYQTGKLAILRLTEFTNVEYSGQVILAFAIHPGAVDTELIQNLPAVYHTNLVDTPQLAADTIVWLTAEKRMWLNGQRISANWDMNEITARKDEIVHGNKLKVSAVIPG